jgi:predicted LPLAT superfamily acyltransferase
VGRNRFGLLFAAEASVPRIEERIEGPPVAIRGTLASATRLPMGDRSAWTGMAERGSQGALLFIRWLYRSLGRRATILFLTPVVAYFLVTGRTTRRFSLDYLRTLWATPGGREALVERPTWRHVFRHLHEFAEHIVDRMIVWSGDTDIIQIDYDGTEILLELSQQRRGAILLGCHLGGWDLLRSVAERTGVTLNVLVFTANAARINAFFERMHPELKLRMIPIELGSIRWVFDVKAAIERGEFVGVLGDRVWESERERSVFATFLGRRALFPLGPFLLQGVIGCPMILTGCFRTGPGRYRAVAIPFASAGVVPRNERRKHAEEQAQRYAHELEQWCVHAPYQWFNFFEFWPEGGA